MKRMRLLSVLGGCWLAAVAACGDDGEPVDCDPSVEQWCDEHDCEGVRTLDDALAANANHRLAGFSLRVCDDRRLVHVGDHLVGVLLSYDADTGALVGVEPYSDIVDENAPCEGDRTAGERLPATCELSCELVGAPPELGLEFNPCPGELGEPWLAQCLNDPPALVEDCAECACPACYPQLIATCPELDRAETTGETETLCAAVAEACIAEHCDDECAPLQRR